MRKILLAGYAWPGFMEGIVVLDRVEGSNKRNHIVIIKLFTDKQFKSTVILAVLLVEDSVSAPIAC